MNAVNLSSLVLVALSNRRSYGCLRFGLCGYSSSNSWCSQYRNTSNCWSSTTKTLTPPTTLRLRPRPNSRRRRRKAADRLRLGPLLLVLVLLPRFIVFAATSVVMGVVSAVFIVGDGSFELSTRLCDVLHHCIYFHFSNLKIFGMLARNVTLFFHVKT